MGRSHDPMCACGLDEETGFHLISECPRFLNLRLRILETEKPKLESLHIKKLITQQKSSAKRPSSVNVRKRTTNHLISPSHAFKPSVVFTFDQFADNTESCKTLSFDSLIESKSKHSSNELNKSNRISSSDRNERPQHDGKPTVIFSFDALNEQTFSTECSTHTLDKFNFEHQSNPKQNALTDSNDTLSTVANFSPCKCVSLSETSVEKHLNENSHIDARLQLLEAILPFYVYKTNDLYTATVSVDGIDYTDSGSNADEAKNNASAKALQNLQKQKLVTDADKVKNNASAKSLQKQEISSSTEDKSSISTEDKNSYSMADDNAFLLLKKIRRGLQYHCNKIENYFSSTVKIDKKEQIKYDKLDENNSFDELENKYVALNYTTLGRDMNNDFLVSVEVETICYYGVGKTVKAANNNAAKGCLQSIQNGKHQKAIESGNSWAVASTTFETLNEKYLDFKFKSLGTNWNNNHQVYVELESIAYYGFGKTIQQASNNAVAKCFQFILNGDRHRMKLFRQ